jgi:putative DNA-invertase from lambdoid prophage Rac
MERMLVYKLDRYARSSTELILETKELLDKGIDFISVSENLDFNSGTAKLHLQILSAFTEFERELIRERTIEGLHRVKLQGKIVGRPKGKKDAKPRRKSGYILREASKKKMPTKKMEFLNQLKIILVRKDFICKFDCKC